MNTYIADITPTKVLFSIFNEDSKEIDNASIEISSEEYDRLDAGTMATDALTIPGWTLDERDCDRMSRSGYATAR